MKVKPIARFNYNKRNYSIGDEPFDMKEKHALLFIRLKKVAMVPKTITPVKKPVKKPEKKVEKKETNFSPSSMKDVSPVKSKTKRGKREYSRKDLTAEKD